MIPVDRRPSLRRNYYRRVRNCMAVAVAIHLLAFLLAPPYEPAPPVMRADPLRLLPARLAWSDALTTAAALAAPRPASRTAGERPSVLAGILQTSDSEVASEQWTPPPVSTARAAADAGAAGGGPPLDEEAPPVYYGYDTPPRALRTIEPSYPSMARASGFEGTVVINVNLDERGKILRAWVASASAPELLIATALDAIYQFEFAPGLDRGVPVRSTVAIPFRFHLNKSS